MNNSGFPTICLFIIKYDNDIGLWVFLIIWLQKLCIMHSSSQTQLLGTHSHHGHIFQILQVGPMARILNIKWQLS
jgi:hypothetical protein